MNKYFNLLNEKKRNIKKLKEEIANINSRLKEIEHTLDNNLIDANKENIILDDLLKYSLEDDMVTNAIACNIIFFVMSGLITILFFYLGVLTITLPVILLILNLLGIYVRKKAIKKIHKSYQKLREKNKKQIEESEKNIDVFRKKAISLNKEKDLLNKNKTNIELSLTLEIEKIKIIEDAVIKYLGPFLDDAVEKQSETLKEQLKLIREKLKLI